MKIRNGFVSNSSSSSFIVFIPTNSRISENDVRDFVLDRFDTDKIESTLQIGFEKMVLKKVEEKNYMVRPVCAWIEYEGVEGFEDFLEKAGLEYIEEEDPNDNAMIDLFNFLKKLSN